MSLVIDANVACDFIKNGRSARIILQEKERGRLIFVANKELMIELYSTSIRNLVAEWARSGSMRIVYTDDVSIPINIISSNDEHILKLLKKSGAMILFTDDRELIKDAKNRYITGKKRKIITRTTSERVCRDLIRRFGN